jgi:hypothetical protein
MDERARRLADNEAVFREINESIETSARAWRQSSNSGGHAYEFVCECSNADCSLRVKLTIAEYERLRANGARFAVRPGHALPEIEDVVERHDDYWVVQKRDDTGEYVELLDPRRAGH